MENYKTEKELSYFKRKVKPKLLSTGNSGNIQWSFDADSYLKADLSLSLWDVIQVLVLSRSHVFSWTKYQAGYRWRAHISVSASIWPEETHAFSLLHCCPRAGDHYKLLIQVGTGGQQHGLNISMWQPLCQQMWVRTTTFHLPLNPCFTFFIANQKQND